MEPVLVWQAAVIGSVVFSRLHSKVLMIVVALGWTGWTIMAVHASPLLALQLFSAWGTVWIISWISGFYHKPDKKSDNATFKTDNNDQPKRVKPEKENGNALNKIGVSFTKGLTQFSDTIDRVNEHIKKEVEKDELNQNFLLKLHSFKASVGHVMRMAEMAHASDKLYENEPEKREAYEAALIKLSSTRKELDKEAPVDSGPVLSSIPLPGFTADISHSPLAVNQRKEKVKECLAFINQLEERISAEKQLLTYIDQTIGSSAFEAFLNVNKWHLNGHLRKLTDAGPNKQRAIQSSDSSHDQVTKPKVIEVTDDVLSEDEVRKKKIKSLVAERKIEYIVHFTRIENLPGILEKGLRGRSLLLEHEDALFNDHFRLDNVNDAVSTSISFPNYRMFFSLQKQNPTADWAVIKISPSILWELDCAFCYSNAAGGATRAVPLDDRRSLEAFEKMFDENLADVARQRLNIPDNYTTDPQAEILILEAVNPKYILSISLNEKAKINNFPKVASVISPYVSSVNFVHDPIMFSPRRDYQHWKPAQDENLKPDQENPYLRDFKF